MRIPLRWLAEYVDIAIEPHELARRLTIAGAEVAEIINTAGDWDGITVAQVTEVRRHPNADRLVLVTVDLGGGERQTVVCGAPNVATGQRIAFARAGTPLIDGRTGKPTVLKAAVIRGIESAGMVCSEKELGLSGEHEGILVLDDAAPVGAPLASVLGETIFDLDLTPNRPDLLSILGVAREVAALSGSQVREPSIEYPNVGPPVKSRTQVDVLEPTLCPRYVAALVENVKIDESPAWLQQRLAAAGMRPINNVVDITNYVMLEMGQPLHAFDFKMLRGGRIIVRRGAVGEKLVLIDGSERDLTPQMLVIADAERAVAVAGVMGGSDTEVSDRTTSILLESANFDAPSIRRTSRELKARTDASIRFEKGLSPQLPATAAQRAVKLIVEICGGRPARDFIDVAASKSKDIRVTLTQERLERVLGVSLPISQVRQVLTSLGFSCRWVPPDHFIVRVPPWRTDVSIPDDVIEEIARIIGYDQLPTSRLRGEIPAVTPQPMLALRERVRDVLASAGIQEVINYSLTDLETLRKVLSPEDIATKPPLRVANPMSRDFEYARTTLRAALLRSVSANRRAAGPHLALFETGRVYLPRQDDLPEEIESLCGAVAGRRPNRWGQTAGLSDSVYDGIFYDAKAYAENLLAALRVEATFRPTSDFCYLPGRTAEIVADGQQIGIVGQVHPRVAGAFDIDTDVGLFEVDLDALIKHLGDQVHFAPASPYPAVEQDIAIVVPVDVPANEALKIIRNSSLVQSASIFDIYSGPPIPPDRKSLAFSISFQSSSKTLTDSDVQRERDRIISRLKEEVGAELRG